MFSLYGLPAGGLRIRYVPRGGTQGLLRTFLSFLRAISFPVPHNDPYRLYRRASSVFFLIRFISSISMKILRSLPPVGKVSGKVERNPATGELVLYTIYTSNSRPSLNIIHPLFIRDHRRNLSESYSRTSRKERLIQIQMLIDPAVDPRP